MYFSSVPDLIWVETDEVVNKLIWCLSLYVVFFEDAGWEILHVVRNNYICVASNCRGEHVSIVRVWQIEGRY